MLKFYRIKDSEIRKVVEAETGEVKGLLVKICEGVRLGLLLGMDDDFVLWNGYNWIYLDKNDQRTGERESEMYPDLNSAKLALIRNLERRN